MNGVTIVSLSPI